MQQAICKLKMAKRNWSVIKLDNNQNVWGEKGQDFFLWTFKIIPPYFGY